MKIRVVDQQVTMDQQQRVTMVSQSVIERGYGSQLVIQRYGKKIVLFCC